MEHLEQTIDDRGVATLTLNRPEVHNAFNPALIGALHAAITALGEDQAVRIIIITGAGKSFSAGADLTWMRDAATYTQQENFDDAMALSDMLNALNSCPKPLIALVNGSTIGGGVGLVACADIVIAHHDATFALSEVKLGLTPATISPFVVRAIGARLCRRLFLTGERFSAVDAERYGLVSMVSDSPDAALRDCLAGLLKNAPHAMQDAKALIAEVSDGAITDSMRRHTAKAIAKRRASDEGREGIDAFLNKRRPNWIKE